MSLTPERMAELREEAKRLRFGELVDDKYGTRKRVWDCPRMHKDDLETLLAAHAERDALRSRLETCVAALREIDTNASHLISVIDTQDEPNATEQSLRKYVVFLRNKAHAALPEEKR